MQASPSGGVAQHIELFLLTALFVVERFNLLSCRVLGALQLLLTGLQAANLKLGLLALLIDLQQRFTQALKFFFFGQRGILQLGMALLGLRQLQVQFFKFGMGSLQLVFKRNRLGLEFSEFRRQLPLALTHLLSLLLQTQHIHIQRMHLGLRLRGLLTQQRSLAGRLRSCRLGAAELRFGFLRNQRLRTNLLVKVFNFLRSGKQACLLRILGVKMNAVQTDRMTLGNENMFPSLQLVSQSHGSI